ncbi:centrosomal protein of 104 kDa-like [Tigriopus californicus]|uniref:centrosomal protein of 104 kDa-like n=1 Tax=Tigriopus californicus TaxID=6832 RepID=UPI0027DA8344|nr:centrosomal protein of 104 kDa-like [Tigriopus californicus]|eukprot:TCALIF_01160-PA protein Name:"Similar to CEP104 Centrosomal protein of 104 kDa (Homo sapiens)" AED:0.00 eAED:0.00 QI:185/0.75/0.8/1/0.75/0.8/5/234/658
MGPHRLPYRVVYCESHDEDYTPSQLLSPGPECKGWRAAQYCIYPEDLIIQLETCSHIEKIQVMVHHTLIPSAIEIQLGDMMPNPKHPDAPPDHKRCLFASLGEVALESNKKINFKGRQMQTIEVDGFNKGLFLKLLLKKNHLNRYNEYNQVSLMGLNVIGTPIDKDKHSEKPLYKLSHRDDLAFLMYMDTDIAEVIEQLEVCRQAAKEARRGEYKNKINEATAGLELAGLALGAKGVSKAIHLEKKDYKAVKELERQIQQERDELYREYNVSDLLEKNGHLPINDERPTELPPPVRHKSRPKSRSPSPGQEPPPRRTSLPPPRSPRRSLPSPISSPSRQSRTPTPPYRSPTPQEETPPRSPSPTRSQPIDLSNVYIDDRDIHPAKDTLPEAEADPEESEESRSPRKTRLSEQDKKELRVAIEVFGEETIMRAINKNPSVKEEADCEIQRTLESYNRDDLKPAKMMRGTTQIVVRMIKDKVWAIFTVGCNITEILFGSFLVEYKLSKKEIEASTSKVYKELIQRGCDTSDRVSDKAEATIQRMLQAPDVQETGVIQQQLLQPLPPNKEHPKMAVIKAELVVYMIDELNLVDRKYSSLDQVTEFGMAAVNHTTARVRKLGEKIMKKLFKIDPDRVRELIPPDNPKNRKANHNLRSLYKKF